MTEIPFVAPSFISAVAIPHRRHSDRVCVPLRLNYNLSSPDRVRVECDRIDAAVSAGLVHPNLSSGRRELLLKNLANEVLEILPIQDFAKLAASGKLEKDGATITFGRPVLAEITVDPQAKTGKAVFYFDEADDGRLAAL